MSASATRFDGSPLLSGLAALLLCAGCGSDSDGDPLPPKALGPPPEVPPETPLPSSCTEPSLPAALATSSTVGDGSVQGCTRQALQEAVQSGGNVTFDCGAEPVTIAMDATVSIAAETIIDGGGLITLDGQDSKRILDVDNHQSLTVVGLTFVRGRASSAGGDRASGGAIRGGWQGTVAVFDCVFAENVAGEEGEEGGGAVYVPSESELTIVRSSFLRNRGGTGGAVHNLLSGLLIVNSTFIDNVATTDGGGGGAVYTDGASGETDDDIGGTIDLCGCRFVGNQAPSQGGAAYLFAYPPDELIVNQCSFESNTVLRPGDGGALGGGLRTGNSPLALGNTLFVDNHSDVHGGGLWVDGDYATTVTNCTFLHNNAGVPGQEGGYGGALSGSNLTLTNVTIVANHAEHGGGAIFNEDTTSVALYNSVLALNTAANEWGLDQSCRDTMVGSNNLQWPAPSSDDPPCTPSVSSGEPLLGELGDHGGPTQTIPLEAGSPALNGGQSCPPTDQRGLPRSEPCDLGAFEVQ